MRVVILGTEYDASSDEKREEFSADFRSRVQLSYRKGFSTPIRLVTGREIDSDAGWGCMLRATQMMLAQCFLALLLGRDWRYEAGRDLAEGAAYLEEPSAWFGPTSAAQAVGHLFGQAASAGAEEAPLAAPAFLRGVACVVFEDGAIYKESVLERFSSGSSAVIILLCRRLGLESFNVEAYRTGLEACFELPEFQGLASGNSASSAHFFVGTHEDCLLYLDPHTVRPALESLDDVRSSPDAGLQPTRPHPLRWQRLNPSVCLGFLVRSSEEFLALCGKLSEGPRGEVAEVLERRPAYAGRAETTAEDGEMVLLE